MSDRTLHETSAEVYHAIKKQHKNSLKVFESYSAPNGDQFGNPDEAKMITAWGFEGADFPIIKAETVWDIDRESPHIRENEQHTFWLITARSDA